MRNKTFFLIILFAFTGLTALQLYPIFLHPEMLIKTSNHADLLFSIWRISWFSHQILHDPLHLFQANIFFPNKSTFAYSDPTLLQGLLAFPLILFSKNPILSYNILLYLTFIISGIGTALFIRYLLEEIFNCENHNLILISSFFASFIFTFFPYRFYLLQSIEHISYHWFGFIFLFLFKFFKEERMKDFILFLFFLVLQTFSSMTLITYLSIALCLLGILFITRQPQLLKPKHLLLYFSGGLFLLCTLFVVYHPYAELHRELRISRSLGSNVDFSANLQWYLSIPLSNPLHDLFYRSISRSHAGYPLFPGIALLLFVTLSFLGFGRIKKVKQKISNFIFLIILIIATFFTALELTGKSQMLFYDDLDNTKLSGFYESETSGTATYRWSKNKFSLKPLKINPNRDLYIYINAAGGRPPDAPLPKLNGYLNGKHVIGLQVLSNSFKTYHIKVRKDDLQDSQEKILKFEMETWNPKTLLNSKDDRELGVMINFMGVTQMKMAPLSWFLPPKIKNFTDEWGISSLIGMWTLFVLIFFPFHLFHRYFICLTLLGVVLSFGPLFIYQDLYLGKGLYYLLYEYFPGFKAFRAPYRFAVLYLFGVSILASIGMYNFFKILRSRAIQTFAVVFSLLLVLFEYFNTNTKPISSDPSYRPIPKVYQWLSEIEGDFGIIHLPISKTPTQDAQLMYWSTFHWKKLVSGYSGYIPKSYYQFLKRHKEIPNEWFFSQIKKLGVKYIIYHSKEDQRKAYPQLIQANRSVKQIRQFEDDFIFQVLE